MIFNYDKMILKTKEFYEDFLGFIINEREIDEYIHSLSLPTYCYVFREIYQMNIIDNDNLATLGDSVLGLCICKYFYDNDASMSKHHLSEMKSRLGSNEFLNSVGVEVLHLNKYLFKTKKDLENIKAYATAVESIIGCIFNQYGLNATLDFFVKYILNYMK